MPPHEQEKPKDADVCIILEGTYPFVSGGVSAWVHDLIGSLPEITFHLVSVIPPQQNRKHIYAVPANVIDHSVIVIPLSHHGMADRHIKANLSTFMREIGSTLEEILVHGQLEHLDRLNRLLAPVRQQVGRRLLQDSYLAWQVQLDIYHKMLPSSSFLDFFWSFRSLIGSLFGIMLAPLPKARVYHTISTGYAGLLAARARLESGRPAFITEHGIYTNERRIEIGMASWLHDDDVEQGLHIDMEQVNLKHLWINFFHIYARICYSACSRILTIYEGNQPFQVDDGADPGRMSVIPNGIDFDLYAHIRPRSTPHPPTVGFIGRVVPIKDVKTLLRAINKLKAVVPELQLLVMGPTEEDEAYYHECLAMTTYLGLHETVRYLGRVKVLDYLQQLDVIVLTSISEGQPLVILEAGASGIPTVATDVGACREMILGRTDEDPPLGPGGGIAPVTDSVAIAAELEKLLRNQAWWEHCSRAIKERVRLYYNKRDLQAAYRTIYREEINRESHKPMMEQPV
ncbi:MAG: GT4 family glycosyltransferase PelF [Magnetococcales bacterium]|nr:GT4 family glycosyltransferase PelF [Magnetococcales bacterium]